ncbi:MAG TPA: AraC family transcriptional regulator [Magnetospirillaceae bacterium]|jgi:AraC-like DNA-binding protein
MHRDLRPATRRGLERSCEPADPTGITAAPAFPGIERIEARFFGAMFEPHRHDTYAIGVTLHGVQTFRYRGEQRFSQPGNILVLHPDEMHDGAAATEAGLRYRMLYLEPALLLRALENENAVLPFVSPPVFSDPKLSRALRAVLGSLDEGLDALFVDSAIATIADGLARHAQQPNKPTTTLARREVYRARDYLTANYTRAVGSAELERVTGLDRYALARQFRALFATSPHRFLVMRRLDHARHLMAVGEPLAQIAGAAGFADQSHFNRHFKRAYGVTPGRWLALLGAGRDSRRD